MKNRKSKRFKARKGQIERSFVMIMTIIIIGVVAYVGYRGAAFLISLQGKQDVQQFWSNLDNEISGHQSFQSFSNYTVILPKGNNYLCFFNTNTKASDRVQKNTAVYGKLPEKASEYWNATRPGDPNVFLSSKKTYTIKNVGFPGGGNYTCFSGGAFSININGDGNLAILSK